MKYEFPDLLLGLFKFDRLGSNANFTGTPTRNLPSLSVSRARALLSSPEAEEPSIVLVLNHHGAFEAKFFQEVEPWCRLQRISSVVKKLDELVPILISCFRESTFLFRAAPIIDAQSFDCMLCTLQCINLAVEIFLNERHMPHASSGLLTPLSNGPNVMRSTMLIHLKKFWESFPIGKMHHSTEKDERYFTLNVRIVEIFLHLTQWIGEMTIPIEKFLEFIESLLLGQVVSNLPSNKVFLEKHFGSVILFIPRLVSQITGSWKTRFLEAFTAAFENCKVDSKLCLAYLSAIGDMLLPMKSESMLSITSSYPDMLGYQIAWIRVLPKTLLHLGNKHSSVSKGANARVVA